MASVHDPVFAMPARSPFAWGASPFLARGSIYLYDLDRIDRTVTGGVDGLLRKANDAALTKWIRQRIGPLEWYDIVPLLYLNAAAASVRGVTTTMLAREVAKAHAERAWSGFSGVVLRMLSPESVALWLPRVSGSYHAFGGVETQAAGPGLVRGVRTGIPRLYVASWAVTSMEFCEDVLRRSGAVEPRAFALAPEQDGVVGGHETYRIPFEVRWKEKT